jgi:hypothetical protein
MHVRQAVLGHISTASGRHLAHVDLGSLIRRLILFDKVIVRSFRLKEVPLLVRTFGADGFSCLLESGLLRFSCGVTTVILEASTNGVRHLPLNHFSFSTAHLENLEATLQSELRSLQGISGLKNERRVLLEELIWGSLVREPATFGQDLLAQIDSDFRTVTPALRVALTDSLRKEVGGRDLKETDTVISVEETGNRVFHIRNKLQESFGFSPEKAHLVLQHAVGAVANLDQRLADMQAHSAITGFLEAEAPMLFGKFAGIIAPMNPQIAERQFERVIQLADIPEFKEGQRVKADSLLKVRDSAECRDFREWLSTLDSISDEELKKMVAGVRSKMATLASSPGGKLVRLATTTGLGLIPGIGLAAGVAASAIDSFLVDRVLPKSGVVAFLTETYPSLFVSP